MQSWLAGPLHLQAITEQTTSLPRPRTCTRMRPCPHVQDGDTQAASSQPVPIHQPNAVLQVWPYAPAADPKWKQGEKERQLLFTHPTSRNSLCVLNSSSSLANRDLCHQKIIACDKRNNNSNSIPRQATSWLKQHFHLCKWESWQQGCFSCVFLWVIKPVITAQKLLIHK